jgi:hypothetical protein
MKSKIFKSLYKRCEWDVLSLCVKTLGKNLMQIELNKSKKINILEVISE